MKYTILSLYFISFCIPHLISAMELVQHPINGDNQAILQRIDQKINEEYSSKSKLVDLIKQPFLNEKDMFNIINMAEQECTRHGHNATPALLDMLYKQNNFFETAINYFTTFARENIDNVIPHNIDFVADQDIPQPIKQLNQLPLSIKQYVINRVYDENESYTIPISLSHTMILYEICPTTHMLATYSKDKNLCLWDLTTGRLKHNFPEDNLSINMIQFNSLGTYMGTIAHYTTKDNQPKSRIMLWSPRTYQLLHNITQNDCVYHIDFAQSAQSNILTVFSQEKHQRHKFLTLWLLNNLKGSMSGQTKPLPWMGEELCDVIQPYNKKYQGYHDPDNDTKICITKKIPPALYLCQKAVENSIQGLQDIQRSQTYTQLTDYEKKMIDNQIAVKNARSNIASPRLQLTMQRK